MLPSYFDYIFVHLRQTARLGPEIFVNFRPENPGPTCNSDPAIGGKICATTSSKEVLVFFQRFSSLGFALEIFKLIVLTLSRRKPRLHDYYYEFKNPTVRFSRNWNRLIQIAYFILRLFKPLACLVFRGTADRILRNTA